MLPKVARVASATAHRQVGAVSGGSCRAGAGPPRAPHPHDLARGRRPLHHAAHGRDARPGQGHAQRRLLPHAGLRPARDGHALAASARRGAVTCGATRARHSTHARGRRARRRSRAVLCGDGAVARRHRRILVRGLLAPQGRRDGPMQDRRPQGHPPRPTSCSRATSTSTSCAARDRSATTRATTRWPTTTRSFTSRASRGASNPSTRRRSTRPPPQEDAWLGRGHRAAVFAAATDGVPRDRRHEPAHRGRVPQPVHRVDQEGLSAPRAQDLSLAVGHGADDVRQVHRRRRPGRSTCRMCARWPESRALNNIDAKRDVFFAEGPIDVLDHASSAFGFGGKLGVDATRASGRKRALRASGPRCCAADARGGRRASRRPLCRELGLP